MKKPENLKILVVGDIMFDKYIVGSIKRISPEAPVPVVNVIRNYHTLGGCGNVVRNLVELGVNVTCLASVGNDRFGKKIIEELKKLKVRDLLIKNSFQTTTKVRVIADERNIQMIRIDKETIGEIDKEISVQTLQHRTTDDYDMIIVSDYAKGMITRELIDYLKIHYSAPIIVDPKPAHGYMYNDVFMITPNEKEWTNMQLSSQYNLKGVNFILETKGSEGMTLHDFKQTWDIPVEEKYVYNVSGAGDTVISIMGICLSMGMEPLQAAYVANECASYVVTKPGTSVVPKNIFMKYANTS